MRSIVRCRDHDDGNREIYGRSIYRCTPATRKGTGKEEEKEKEAEEKDNDNDDDDDEDDPTVVDY